MIRMDPYSMKRLSNVYLSEDLCLGDAAERLVDQR